MCGSVVDRGVALERISTFLAVVLIVCSWQALDIFGGLQKKGLKLLGAWFRLRPNERATTGILRELVRFPVEF